MVTGLIGKKLGMTQLFTADGTVQPATVLKAGPCVVVQAKSVQADGYEAVQLGLVEAKPTKENKPSQGHFKKAGVDDNGWTFTTNAGRYGTDYMQRAFITAIGLGANRPQDAVYPTSQADAAGKPYEGANKYVVRLPKGQMPPAKAFWSITMYDADYFFVDNPINRYTVSSRSAGSRCARVSKPAPRRTTCATASARPVTASSMKRVRATADGRGPGPANRS